jgi:RND family efflux transporter MFP subunit
MTTRVWIAAGLAACLGLTSACRRPPPPAPAAPVVLYERARAVTDLVSQTGLGASQIYLGIIRGETETDLSFRVGGIIAGIGDAAGDWREGAVVARDAVLAWLQPADFLAVSNQARARLDYEGARFTNNAKLFAERAISQQEMDAIQSAYRSAEAEYERASQNLRDSIIRAPFAGTIIARLANAGETVMPGRPVLRLADLKTVSVELGVPDRILSEIRPGERQQVWIRALEGTPAGPVREGEVTEVGVAAREGSRLFRVVMKVNNEDGAIKSGMTASVEIRPRRRFAADAVAVPLSALVGWTGSPTQGPPEALAVFVVDDAGRARQRRVRTDDLIRSSVVITEGLAIGEKVVVVGAAGLHDGAVVNAQPLRSPGAPATPEAP